MNNAIVVSTSNLLQEVKTNFLYTDLLLLLTNAAPLLNLTPAQQNDFSENPDHLMSHLKGLVPPLIEKFKQTIVQIIVIILARVYTYRKYCNDPISLISNTLTNNILPKKWELASIPASGSSVLWMQSWGVGIKDFSVTIFIGFSAFCVLVLISMKDVAAQFNRYVRKQKGHSKRTPNTSQYWLSFFHDSSDIFTNTFFTALFNALISGVVYYGCARLGVERGRGIVTLVGKAIASKTITPMLVDFTRKKILRIEGNRF